MSTNFKKGVLLVNLGTPDAPSRSAVYRYLKQFLLDRRVIDYPWLLEKFAGTWNYCSVQKWQLR